MGWLFLVGYLVIWYLTAGLFFAFHQRRFSSIAAAWVREDRVVSIGLGLVWPIFLWMALGASIINKTGWLNPFSNPHKKVKGPNMKRSKRKTVVSALVSKILLGGPELIRLIGDGGSSTYLLISEVDGKLIVAKATGLFGVEVEVVDPMTAYSYPKRYTRGDALFRESMSFHRSARKLVKQKIRQIAVEKLEAKIKEREDEQLRILKQVGLDFSKE